MNVDREFNVGVLLERLVPLAPSGFAVALHIRYTAPRFLFQNYPRRWRDHYSKMGLVMFDRTVAWGLSHEGAVRWSDLEAAASTEERRVFDAARRHGLNFGLTVAMADGSTRSIGSAARGDREFTDDECADILSCVSDLHEATGADQHLTEADHATLHRLSIHLTRET